MSGWPFAVGERVKPRGNWGPLCDPLRVHSEANPDATYAVHAVRAGGRWLSLRDNAGHVYQGMSGPSFGPTYFRIAGECGTHVATFRGGADGHWLCARCDVPLPAPDHNPDKD